MSDVATDEEIREIRWRIANGEYAPWSVFQVEALLARIAQEIQLQDTAKLLHDLVVKERNLAWHHNERLKAQERILLDWQKDATSLLHAAACECDEYQGFRCLRCGLLSEVHPDNMKYR